MKEDKVEEAAERSEPDRRQMSITARQLRCFLHCFFFYQAVLLFLSGLPGSYLMGSQKQAWKNLVFMALILL